MGGLAPSSSRKRCVYRGMGALCQRQPSLITSGDPKLFTCAPNFYCADLAANSFNSELARDPDALFNILFGFEADVLGRPAHYLNANDPLPTVVQDNIRANTADALGLPANNAGLCRPGKNIAADHHQEQHQTADRVADPTRPYSRTDYINQIGSCNSTPQAATTSSADIRVRASRVWGCPLFDSEDNYTFTSSSPTPKQLLQFSTQNSCGNNSQDNSGENSFAPIEAEELGRLGTLTQPSHAEHACLRRAGSPCFTDLDCTPSRLHADTASFLGLNHFGGTQGEKDYWTEHLICGQVQEQPIFGTPAFKAYQLTKNRCCRAIGNNLTIVAQRDEPNGEGGVSPDITRPIGDFFPTMGRDQPRRYSRFMSIYQDILSPTSTLPLPYQKLLTINSANRNDCQTSSSFASTGGCRDGAYQNATQNHQWQAPYRVATRTCCGGGWVRKFADGTHDWTLTDRMILSVENFSCLNYQNPYLFRKPAGTSVRHYNQDINRACREARNQGCPQVSFVPSNGFEINAAPVVNRLSGSTNSADRLKGLQLSSIDSSLLVAKADYSSLNDNQQDAQEIRLLGEDLKKLGPAGRFAPSGIRLCPRGANPLNPDRPWLDADRQQVEYCLPAYVNVLDSTTENNLVSIGVSYALGAGSISDFKATSQFWTRSQVKNSVASSPASPSHPATTFKLALTFSNGDYRLRLSCDPCSPLDFDRAWPIIEFIPQGTRDYRARIGDPTIGETAHPPGYDFPFVKPTSTYGMMPGSDLYYLTKLGRLELIGIPQLHYEPLYCNSDMSRLLPGLYRHTSREQVEITAPIPHYASLIDGDIVDFDTASTKPISGDQWVAGQDNPNHFVLAKEQMAINDIFSENEIMCCAKLGTPVTNAQRCCTHHARTAKGAKRCALPAKIDLMVYFNRFISSEGRFDPEDEPGGLREEDFNPKTGEPKLQQSTYDKIRALGQKYCDNDKREKTRTGAAMGEYLVEPLPGDGRIISSSHLGTNDPALRRYGIVDSTNDSGINSKGYKFFAAGFRWNHHLYCE